MLIPPSRYTFFVNAKSNYNNIPSMTWLAKFLVILMVVSSLQKDDLSTDGNVEALFSLRRNPSSLLQNDCNENRLALLHWSLDMLTKHDAMAGQTPQHRNKHRSFKVNFKQTAIDMFTASRDSLHQ